jgi:hypothetical protein
MGMGWNSPEQRKPRAGAGRSREQGPGGARRRRAGTGARRRWPASGARGVTARGRSRAVACALRDATRWVAGRQGRWDMLV